MKSSGKSKSQKGNDSREEDEHDDLSFFDKKALK